MPFPVRGHRRRLLLPTPFLEKPLCCGAARNGLSSRDNHQVTFWFGSKKIILSYRVLFISERPCSLRQNIFIAVSGERNEVFVAVHDAVKTISDRTVSGCTKTTGVAEVWELYPGTQDGSFAKVNRFLPVRNSLRVHASWRYERVISVTACVFGRKRIRKQAFFFRGDVVENTTSIMFVSSGVTLAGFTILLMREDCSCGNIIVHIRDGWLRDGREIWNVQWRAKEVYVYLHVVLRKYA